MAKAGQKIYICTKCDAQFSKWNGRCFECGGWGTLKEDFLDQKEVEKKKIDVPAASVTSLDKVESSFNKRLDIGMAEVDRVLGGGIVPGALILVAGEPGIGKSTLLLQIADKIKGQAIYISGEESAIQIKDRAERLGCDLKNLKLITETSVEKIISSIEKERPHLAIIDSIQTMYSLLSDSEPGSVSQIRISTQRFLEVAKKSNISIIISGHITKDGQVAGPKTLEHIVDTVVYLESEKAHDYRVMRATKNRFGSVNELGIFEMTSQGFKEVSNPSAVFLDIVPESMSGSVISVIMEGTRPFLVELQALVTKTVFGYPQRKASGFDLNRLQVLTAVLTKRANINLTNQDVILNIVGGLRLSDPALDLAASLAITASLLNQTISRKTIVLGEVGLGGEVRKVGKLKERLNEAIKLGFEEAIIPDANINIKDIKLTKVKKLEDIVNTFK